MSKLAWKISFLIAAPFLIVLCIPIAIGLKLADVWIAYSAWYDEQFPEHGAEKKEPQ